ncbi:MAG: hypothetical protein G8D89_02975 [gamma proteobacterium symbiont of Clathrolucina costata]
MKLSITGPEAVDLAVHTINTTIYGTGGANVLARVLLHAYNAAEQPLNISDLCTLDSEKEEWAWAILKLRVDGVEPNTIASDQAAFQRIVDKYWIEPST